MVAGAWPGGGAAAGAPRHPLLGDFEPGNVGRRQSGPCRAAWLPCFLRDRRSPRGLTHLPGTEQGVSERSQGPQQSVLCPFCLALPPGLSGICPRFRGDIPAGTAELCPEARLAPGGRQRLPHKGQTLGTSGMTRLAPKSLRSDAPGTGSNNLRAPVLVSLGTTNLGKPFLGKPS